MALEVATEETIKDASIMASPEIKRVSLVRHAANREPFRAVKNDSGGGESMAGAVVQRIVAPEGADVLALLASEGITFDGELSLAVKSNHEGFDIYTQAGVENFEKDSFSLRKAADKSDCKVMVVTGKLKSEHKVPKVVALKNDLASPLSTTVVDVEIENGYYGMYVTTTTAMDSLDNELWNFNKAIYALGNASGMDGKARLKSMVAVVDGFRNFVNNLVTFVEDNKPTSTKGDDTPPDTFAFPKISAMIAAVEGMSSAPPSEAHKSEEDMTIDAEALAKTITEGVVAGMTEVIKSAMAPAPKEEVTPTEAVKSEEDPAKLIADLKATVEKMEAANAELTTKVKSLEEQPETTAQAQTPDTKVPTESVKTEKVAPENPTIKRLGIKQDMSVFKGLFANLRGATSE